MNEPTEGHLVTLPVEALHQQLTHFSFISWRIDIKKETCWRFTPSPPSSLSLSLLKSPWRQEKEAKWGGEIVRESERWRHKQKTSSPPDVCRVDGGKIIPPLPSHDNHSNDLSLLIDTDFHPEGGERWGVWVPRPLSETEGAATHQGLERLKDATPSRVCAFVCLCEVSVIRDDVSD